MGGATGGPGRSTTSTCASGTCIQGIGSGATGTGPRIGTAIGMDTAIGIDAATGIGKGRGAERQWDSPAARIRVSRRSMCARIRCCRSRVSG